MSYFSAKSASRKKQGEPLAPSLRAAAAAGTTLEDLQRSAQKLAPQIKAHSQAAQASFDSWLYELRLEPPQHPLILEDRFFREE